ncbi:MAG TPA: 50S ribosomal protein L32 [Candidatus Paceibacterota bacterium]|nr:50S ribosomal protein L32 [Candidatus Paceibacterota bacterium]
MAVPKQHDSKGKVGSRRSQKKLKKQNVIACPFCKAPTLPHKVCPNCGRKAGSKKKDNK